MKKIILFTILLAAVATSKAQWSNTTNQFYDSLDMPVAQAAYNQSNPLVVKSEPDGGYFIIWEDNRNNNKTDIYAQKYDKDGNRLWAQNGVPVATGSDNQVYNTIANGTVTYTNYHSVSHAATDGNGGFYIAFTTLDHYDVYVQHIKSDGSPVFAAEGYPLAVHSTGGQTYYSQPQLIADGNGGFFIGYLTQSPYYSVWVYCYKDEGGTLKSYGGGQMDVYYQQLTSQAQCGTKFDINFTPAQISVATLSSFVIFPDRQGGCGVAMVKTTGAEKQHPAFNWLARVKKASHVIKDVYFDRSFAIISPGGSDGWEISGGTPDRYEYFYKKDSVLRVYSASTSFASVSCNVGTTPPLTLVEYTNNFVNNEGIAILRPYNGAYGIEKINAAVMTTDGNINAALITWNERDYTNSKVTNWATRGQAIAMEKYDSLPYQLCSDVTHPNLSYNPVRPPGMNKLNEGVSDIDTLMAASGASYAYDYSLMGTADKALLASSTNGLGSGASPFYYQELKVVRQNTDSFALKINTGDKNGVLIGTGTGYDRFLHLAGDGVGNATFYYVGPNGRDHVNASPIDEGGRLRWGPFGMPLNSGGVASSYFYPSSPFLYMDAGGSALVAWSDGRKTPNGYTAENVYMRHLDSLLKTDYQPPLLAPQLTVNLNSPNYTNITSYPSYGTPQSLAGNSKAWTTFPVEVAGAAGSGAPVTPVVQIKDDYNLGAVTVQTNENFVKTLRTTPAGHPYLDRNYTITVTNHPAGASIHVRLIFSKGEFDSLKAHEATIQDPGDLAVIKQPSNGTLAKTYTPVAGEQGIKPTGWGAIFGANQAIAGYYIEIVISDFSNFFIMSAPSALPVTLQSFTVKAVNNTALLQWETASEVNNNHFDIERSASGNAFTKIGRVQGFGTTTIAHNYWLADAAPLPGNNYYRLAQVDLDGKITYSQIRLLSFNGQGGTLKVFPNPVRSTLHIQMPQAASGQHALKLYNLAGINVLVQSVPAGTLQMDADISTLAPGMYIVRYGNESVKVVKE